MRGNAHPVISPQIRHLISCPDSGLDHQITVDLPLRHAQLDAPPVLIVFDGQWMAGAVRDATRIMSMANEAPEAIVVGVSFSADAMSDYLRRRAMWFTPTQFLPPAEVGVKGLNAADTGRAAQLRSSLRETVLPWLDAQGWNGERWLVGHSFSGLFGLHTLWNEPELFARYLLASPSIWWDDRAILDQEQQWAAAHDDLPARVFLSAGDDELGLRASGGLDAFRMAENVAEVRDRLGARDFPSLQIEHRLLGGETHNSTIGAAISHGLRALHGWARPG